MMFIYLLTNRQFYAKNVYMFYVTINVTEVQAFLGKKGLYVCFVYISTLLTYKQAVFYYAICTFYVFLSVTEVQAVFCDAMYMF